MLYWPLSVTLPRRSRMPTTCSTSTLWVFGERPCPPLPRSAACRFRQDRRSKPAEPYWKLPAAKSSDRKLILVSDNGCGMIRDDALLAFERHATSKIKDADDLLNIDTLGFRGEALPSIASVSRVSLQTRSPEQASGTILEIAGGKILKVDEAGLPAGTSIAVRDLFFNTPARKKFLNTKTTELSHTA